MDRAIPRRLLRIARRLELTADSRLSFDQFVQDVNKKHEDMADTIRDAENIKDLLERSGYPELAGRMSQVIEGIRETSDVIDKFRKMYSQGKLRYGPRLPESILDRRVVQRPSPILTQEPPWPSRPTRDLDVDA